MSFTHEDHGVDLKGVVWSKKDSALAEVVILDSDEALKLDCSGEVVSIPLNELELMEEVALDNPIISVASP